MSRRMSCSMTIPAVKDRTKTVTRRHPDTWKTLRVGDRLTLIEKGMGLPKGATQVVLCEVEIVGISVEPIYFVLHDAGATAAEGLPHLSRAEFVAFWQRSHGNADTCRRIEWRYLDPFPTTDETEEPTDG